MCPETRYPAVRSFELNTRPGDSRLASKGPTELRPPPSSGASSSPAFFTRRIACVFFGGTRMYGQALSRPGSKREASRAGNWGREGSLDMGVAVVERNKRWLTGHENQLSTGVVVLYTIDSCSGGEANGGNSWYHTLGAKIECVRELHD